MQARSESLYHDRIRSPAETVAWMQPHFAALGITRVARQTGLDRLGIPCYSAFRPNARLLACNQGKGVDDNAARASAVMEAAEYAVAEVGPGEGIVASAEALMKQGSICVDPIRVLPIGVRLEVGRPIRWAPGYRLADHASAHAPLDMVRLGRQPTDLPDICQNTNGLASGNNGAEASFHALCELIERDAGTLWKLVDIEEKQARCVAPEAFGDPLIVDLVQRFTDAGLDIRLFDQTADLGIPTILAVSGPPKSRWSHHFDIATGTGTHPHAARAALRAITEAAQTRVTSIAGARDDIPPGHYRLEGSEEAFALLAAKPQDRLMPGVDFRNTGPEPLLEWSLGVLAEHGIDDVVAVPLGGHDMGFAVVRLISSQLEDLGPNRNWRPGQRALSRLLEAA